MACEHCGREFYRRPTQRGRFCSLACRKAAGAYLSTGVRRGEENPNWRHGRREGQHARGFTVLLKQEWACRTCGSTENLHLHHIVPRSKWRDAARDDLRNGMTLCALCHNHVHLRRSDVRSRLLGSVTAAERAYAEAHMGEGWLDVYYGQDQ